MNQFVSVLKIIQAQKMRKMQKIKELFFLKNYMPSEEVMMEEYHDQNNEAKGSCGTKSIDRLYCLY